MSETYNKPNSIEEMERQYSQYKSPKHLRKDQGNIIIITITIITMTMTEIDHIVEIDHESTTEMTIEKIIGRSKTGNIEADRDYYGDTCDDR